MRDGWLRLGLARRRDADPAVQADRRDRALVAARARTSFAPRHFPPESLRRARKVPMPFAVTFTVTGRVPVKAVTVTCSPGLKPSPRTTSGDVDSTHSAVGRPWPATSSAVPEVLVDPSENSNPRSMISTIATPAA
jgi:hypothetical protein